MHVALTRRGDLQEEVTDLQAGALPLTRQEVFTGDELSPALYLLDGEEGLLGSLRLDPLFHAQERKDSH
ncbi:hypothetical protein ACFC63_21630 [Streptomyces albidoflavus]